MNHRSSLSSRIARLSLAFVLAIGLVPTAAFAAGADEASATEASVSPTLVEGTYVEGQALVLYRVDGDGATTLSEDGSGDAGDADAAVLADSGFTVDQTWDFSAVDEALDTEEASLLSAEGVEVDSDGELRLALVSRDGASTEDLIAELEALDFVEAAQPNEIHTLTAAEVPDDTHYENWQYGLTSETAGIDLEAALAARGESSTESNIVAVIDSAVGYTNPDLADQMWKNPGIDGLPGSAGSHGYDFYENDDDPMSTNVSLDDSHGTHCAGVIAAATGNGEGVAGGSSDTEIMALKVAGDGSEVLVDSALISSYQYVVGAALAGENVVAINCSWGVGHYNYVIEYLINQAGKAGILSVISAGNSGVDTRENVETVSTTGIESPYALIVASSNELNELSSFSNYNETDVDLAAPGEKILSTVGTGSASLFFSPILSHQAGRELETYCDFSDFAENPDAYTIAVARVDGVELTDEERQAFTVEYAEDAGHGEPGLRVVVDTEKLAVAPPNYRFAVTWLGDNFFQGSDHDVEDYAIGAYVELDSSANPSNALVAESCVLENPSTGEVLSGDEFCAYAYTEDFYIYNTALSSTDDSSEQLKMGVMLAFTSLDGGGLSGTVTATLTGFGVGVVAGEGVTEETSAYEPYGLMTGTSMAAPMISGVVAQLAALNPDASPLELRGTVVGSTVALDQDEDDGRHTATDGRFSWDAALDDEPPSANTWAVDADAETGEVTVYGLGLSDATLYLDGEAVEPTSRTDDAITFTAPLSAFDGEEHSFNVVDASTGQTHRAAYAMPLAEASYALELVTELPDELFSRENAVLAASDSALYLADAEGSYLYMTEDPRTGAWTRLTALGVPFSSGDYYAHQNLAFGAWGDTLYAFAVEIVDTGSETAPAAERLYVASYDVEADRWSDFELLDEVALPVSSGASAVLVPTLVASTDDGLYCVFRCQYSSEYIFEKAYRLADEAEGFAEVTLPGEDDGDVYCLASLASVDGSLGAVAVYRDQASGDYSLHALVYDAEADDWDDRGTFADAEEVEERIGDKISLALAASFGSGVVMAGLGLGTAGDLSLFDFDELTWESVGSFGIGTSSGQAVSSIAVYNDRLYLLGTADGAVGAIYTLPYSITEELLGIDCPTASYPDIDHDAWYHEYVDWAVSTGLMTGYDEGAGDHAGWFGPDDELTRAQMAQILYNAAGRPAVSGDAPFADCDATAWYDDAVAWVASEGIFIGYQDGSNRFGPDDVLTREQMAIVLWRLAGEPDGSGDLSRFPDGLLVSDWALDAVVWAVGEGILSGYDDTGLLDPASSSTRAQAAAVLERYAGLQPA